MTPNHKQLLRDRLRSIYQQRPGDGLAIHLCGVEATAVQGVGRITSEVVLQGGRCFKIKDWQPYHIDLKTRERRPDLDATPPAVLTHFADAVLPRSATAEQIEQHRNSLQDAPGQNAHQLDQPKP